MGNSRKAMWSSEEARKRSHNSPSSTSRLLVGASHCLNPAGYFKGVQKVQSAGAGLLGCRAGQRRAENRFGTMEEENQEWLASFPSSILHFNTQVLALKR